MFTFLRPAVPDLLTQLKKTVYFALTFFISPTRYKTKKVSIQLLDSHLIAVEILKTKRKKAVKKFKTRRKKAV